MSDAIAVGEIHLDPEVRQVRADYVSAQLAAMTWEPAPMPADYRPQPGDHPRERITR